MTVSKRHTIQRKAIISSTTGLCSIALLAVALAPATALPQAPAPAPAPSGTITIAPLGSPRIIFSDPATAASLRARLGSNEPAAVRFKESVDRTVRGEDVYDFQPWQVAMEGQITGDPKYCAYAVAKTDEIVRSEEALIASGEEAAVAGDSYLLVGDYVGGISMVYDWCRSSTTPAQRARWATYANQAVWNVWHPDDAKWGANAFPWTGWSIDNPSNNYYYSFLRATMTLGLATSGENDMAPDWINQFRNVKFEGQLVPTFTRDLVGGGSREGTGYGVAMRDMFQLYDWWERSTGERIADKTPHTLASMFWMIHTLTPTLDRFVNTGDQSRDSTATLFDYHRDYLQKLASMYPNERASGAVKTLLAQSSVPRMSTEFMRWSDYLYGLVDIAPRPLTELSTAYWGPGTGSFSMRNDWTRTSAYANFICGPYSESHAHQDQGSFVLFKGSWLAFDSNNDSHSGLSQDQWFHNTVRFENAAGKAIGQNTGRTCTMAALANTPGWAYASADISPVFAKAITKSEREFVFIKPSTFVVYDRAQTRDATTRRIFTMNFPKSPTINGNAISLVAGANRLDMIRILPAEGTYTPVVWKTAKKGDFPKNTTATRVDLVDTNGGTASEFLHVIGLDGSVSGASPINAAGQSGTSITLADGRVVNLWFNQATRGGTIEIRSATGAIIESHALPTSVEAPPIYAN